MKEYFAVAIPDPEKALTASPFEVTV